MGHQTPASATSAISAAIDRMDYKIIGEEAKIDDEAAGDRLA